LDGLARKRRSKAIGLATDEALAVAVVVEHDRGSATLLTEAGNPNAIVPHARDSKSVGWQLNNQIVPVTWVALVDFKVVSATQGAKLCEQPLPGVVLPAWPSTLLHVAVSKK